MARRKEEHIMRKTERKIIEKVAEARKKSREAKSGNGGMFLSKTPQRCVGANETSRRYM